MSSRSSRRLSGLCSPDDVTAQLPPRKRPGYWLTPPKPSVYSASASAIQEASPTLDDSPPLEKPGSVFDHSFRRKRRCVLQLEGDMDEEQVTRDLCTSFQIVESTESRKFEVMPWRRGVGTNSTSNGIDMQQSGTTSEEDLVRCGQDNMPGADTVRSAAELLTQLTCGRSVDSNGQSPDVSSCTPHSRYARRGLELPIRWGVKKKVSYESRRSVDSCDLGLCTGLMRKFPNDLDKTSARPPGHSSDKKTETALSSVRHGSLHMWNREEPRRNLNRTVKKFDGHTSPYCPASSEFYEVLEPSGEAGTSSGLQLARGPTEVPGDQRQNRTSPSASRTFAGRILKLPRDMQGRWSSERYKSAQLKLVDIMHARKSVPGKPILRPALREEARKHIGDTGLLDHLLKHMTDTVVSTGERFRRRHNSEGAMEYWLEHASLMDLRKAAGVEDPSWIPPLGWKAGDKLPDWNWQVNRHGLTLTEAAEMKHLKETVDRLKSDMKVLCGSIKVSYQRGVLTSLSVSHQIPSGDTPIRGEEELDSTQEIRKDSMIQCKTEMTNVEQQFHQEHTAGIKDGLGITVEPGFPKVESGVLEIHEERTPQNEIPLVSGNQVDLESQLQDVCKTVAIMQADVSDIIKILGIVPPIKAKPVRYPIDLSTPGHPLPFLLSTGDGSSMTCSEPPVSQPPATPEPVLHKFVTPKVVAPMRQCSTFSNVMDQCSNGGDVMSNLVPYADGLSQALSNYKLVNEADLFSVEEKFKPTENTLSTGLEGVPPVVANLNERRAPNFKPIFAGQPTGFRLCRPAGSFVWPNVMNCTPTLPTNNPSMTRSQDHLVELRGPEDDSGNAFSPQALGLSNLTPTIAPVRQANSSSRSMAESHVAAALASMFGCMATAPHLSVPTQPLMSNVVALSAKGTVVTTMNHSGHGSSPEGQSDPALSLSLSLSVPAGSHLNVGLKKSV